MSVYLDPLKGMKIGDSLELSQGQMTFLKHAIHLMKPEHIQKQSIAELPGPLNFTAKVGDPACPLFEYGFRVETTDEKVTVTRVS
jgi:hypothetical protein